MKVTSMLALFFVALVTGAAVPDDAASGELYLREETDSSLDKRARYDHIKVCDSANYQGRCKTFNVKSAVCHTFANHWPNTITSIHVSKGTTCTLYNRNNCKGRKIGGIVNPGITNLAKYGFNDQANSLKCS